MQRRKFIHSSLISGAGISLSGNTLLYHNLIKKKRKPVFKKGDMVGLLCPGSAISEEQLQLAKMQMKSYGLVPYVGKNAMKKSGYLAGTDEERVGDMHEMYAHKKVKAIWAIRGGYGTGRLLPLLDFDLIKKNKKPLIGYSDLTAPINFIYQKTGTVNYHCTMPGAIISAFAEKQIEQFLFNTKYKTYSLDAPLEIKNKGRAKGILLGGNVSVLNSLIGTPYEIDFDGSILFLEDVGEKPYRLDRMLTQMKQSGAFDKIKGLILGQFTDCEGDMRNGMESIEDLVASFFSHMDIPIVTNAPIGHISEQWALPIGMEVSMEEKELVVISGE